MEAPKFSADKHSGSTESSERTVIYTAEFVKDPQELLRRFAPKHSVLYAHHSTIEFMPDTADGIEVGKEGVLKIVGRAYDDKGDALLVENPKSKNTFPHITLSCAEGVSAAYSNELLEKAAANGTIEYFETPYEVAVIEGYFDGSEAVIK